jgi:hypothetical protein
MRFELWDAPSGGSKIWEQTKFGVHVQGGLFTVGLDINPDHFEGRGLWLAIEVNGQMLSPRQELLASPYALTLRPGATVRTDQGYAAMGWATGNIGLIGVSRPSFTPPGGLYGVYGSGDGTGLYGVGGWAGVYGTGDNHGVKGESTNGEGLRGVSANASGVIGEGGSGDNDYGGRFSGWGGVHVDAQAGPGIHVNAGGGSHGVQVASAGSHGVDIVSANGSGVQVYSAGGVGVRVVSAGNDGVRVDSANWSGVYVNSAGGDAMRVENATGNGVNVRNAGGDLFAGGPDRSRVFRVANNGTVFAKNYQTLPDFAEMMAFEGDANRYEPGDVLVISDSLDRAVQLSSRPYSTAVIGVYSTAPGFIGSQNPMERSGDELPVAITGIVPCKVSAENGPIQRGDLLTTSSTPGHAMRASDPQLGTLVGKAMGELASGTGVIEILVVLQ